MAASWPPGLETLRVDLGREPDDTSDTEVLRDQLAAAVAYVRRVHRGRYRLSDSDSVLLPLPDDDLIHGTVRLAKRLKSRQNSPDGVISAGELGSIRVGTGDQDIDRMLQVGKFARPVIA